MKKMNFINTIQYNIPLFRPSIYAVYIISLSLGNSVEEDEEDEFY